VINEAWTDALGDALGMGQSAAVTLGDKCGYEGFALVLIHRNKHSKQWNNFCLALGFKQKPKRADGSYDGSDATVASLFEEVMEMFGTTAKKSIATLRTDRAALGLGPALLDRETPACDMHDGDKLGQSALGKLIRRDMTQPIDPATGHRPFANEFAKGVALLNKIHALGRHFATGSRHSVLMTLGQTMKLDFPLIRMKMPKNGTRVAAIFNLVASQARLNKVVKLYDVTRSSEFLSKLEWEEHSEVEAVLGVSRLTTTLSQYEKPFMGSFGSMIKQMTMKTLRHDNFEVIDYDAITSSPRLRRVAKPLVNFTALGQEVVERMRLEAERRFCGNTGEDVDGSSEVVMARSE